MCRSLREKEKKSPPVQNGSLLLSRSSKKEIMLKK
jgi:hypothetical protein